MALQVEDVGGAFPHGLTAERLLDRLSANQDGISAVLAFNGSL
jgi:hypothetical protein